MGITSKNNNDFQAKIKDINVHGENVVFIKGGAVAIEDKWVFLTDLRLDVQETVKKFVENNSRRLFNSFNSDTYVLIVRTKNGDIEVVPTLSFNKKSFGDVKSFPDLSGKLPLMLVRLRQDGSAGLTGISVIKSDDIEIYKGYGNFTLKGSQGATGFQGIEGFGGVTGMYGITGPQGETGYKGETGVVGEVLMGATGIAGEDGIPYPSVILFRDNTIVLNSADDLKGIWQDTTDDSEDIIQGTP